MNDLGFLRDVRFETPRSLDALWLLPLLVVLYLLRRRASRVDVPFLPFWERVLASRRRKPSFARAVLSVLLQAAVFAAAVLALAGPYVETPAAAAARTTFVVADRTAAAAPFSAEVAARTAAAAAEAAADGPVALVAWTAGGVRSVRAADEPRPLDEAVRLLPPPRGGRDPEVLARALAALDPAARVVVVTPFTVPVGGPLARAGVVAAGAADGYRNGGIRGATRDGDALLVRVDGAEGRGVVATAPAFGRVVVPADKGGVVHVPLAADFSGRVALELDPVDPWPEDDAAAFDVAPGRRIAVAVVSAGETPALDAALRASGLVDARRSGRVEPARWREAAAGFDVVVLVGRDEESPLPAGRYLLVDAAAPGLPLARVEGPAKARATRRAGEARWLATLDPEEWEIRKASVFAATAGADVLVEGDRGPLFVRLRRGDVDAFALTVPPTEAASTLPLLPAFPLMIRGLLEELAPAAVSPTVVAVDPAGLRPPFSEAPEPAEAREAAAGPPARPGPPIRSSLRAALFAALLVLLVVEWWLYHLGATD